MLTDIRITVAVSDHWLLGTLPLRGHRIQDVLNDSCTDFLQLHDVEVHRLSNCERIDTLRDVAVPKCKTEFVLVPSTAHEAPVQRWNNLKTKTPYSVFTVIGQYYISGNVHLSGKLRDSQHALIHELGQFFPLTAASLSRGRQGIRELHVPLLFANKNLVSCIQVGEDPGVHRQSEARHPVGQPQEHSTEEVELRQLVKKVHELLGESLAATGPGATKDSMAGQQLMNSV